MMVTYLEGSRNHRNSSEKKMSEPPEPQQNPGLKGCRWRGWWGELKASRQGLTLEPHERCLFSGDHEGEILGAPRPPAWHRPGTKPGTENGINWKFAFQMVRISSWSYHPQSTLAHSHIPSIEHQLQGKLLENLLEKKTYACYLYEYSQQDSCLPAPAPK